MGCGQPTLPAFDEILFALVYGVWSEGSDLFCASCSSLHLTLAHALMPAPLGKDLWPLVFPIENEHEVLLEEEYIMPKEAYVKVAHRPKYKS